MGSRTFLYVGTYTRPAPYLATTNGEGIYVLTFDPSTGALTSVSDIEGIDSPSFLAIDHTKRYLYATSEVWGWHEGIITACAIDPQTGALSYLNKVAAMGSISAYIEVEASNRYALVANYWNGTVGMFPILEDGRIGQATHVVQHEGKGVDPARQEGPHCHCIVPDPANRFAIVADLGTDKLFVYELDLENGRLLHDPARDHKLKDGAGPRHFRFHPNGRNAYVIQELNSTITALAYDGSSGTFRSLNTLSALPPGYDGHSHCSDLHVHPSGRFLYGANRGHDSIGIFAIDEQSGEISYVGHQATGGKTPRNFCIDPTGHYLLAGNQDSDTIVTFRINQDTGRLEETGHVASVPTPVCLKMIEL